MGQSRSDKQIGTKKRKFYCFLAVAPTVDFSYKRKKSCQTFPTETLINDLLMPSASVNGVPTLYSNDSNDRNWRAELVDLPAAAHSFALWVTRIIWPYVPHTFVEVPNRGRKETRSKGENRSP